MNGAAVLLLLAGFAAPEIAGCEVHLVARDDENRELRFPCGCAVRPPRPGWYDVWLESGDAISSRQVRVQYDETPLRNEEPLIPAGLASVPVGSSEEYVSLVSVDRDFQRRAVRDVTRMPPGRVVAMRIDLRSSDVLAVTRPFEVRAGQTTPAYAPAPGASDVVAVLEKPRDDAAASVLLLHDGETGRAADVTIDRADRITAIWYGVDARVATLSMRSDAFFLAPREVRLTRGRVVTVRAALQRAPRIVATITAPADAPLPDDLELTVSRAGEHEPIRSMRVKPGAHELERLPAEPLRVMLRIDRWKFFRDVDLSSGDDGTATFELTPIEIEGTVHHGDDRAAAAIEFLNSGAGDDWVRVETDDDGRYRVLLWRRGNYTVQVRPRGSHAAPFLDAFRWIEKSGTIDFRLPRTDYRVRIVDAHTGNGIAGAELTVGSEWIDDESRKGQTAQLVRTDARGVAVLPPQRNGEITLHASARGYASAQPLQMTVDNEPHELEIRLEPSRAAGRLRIALPGGAPAAGAEVMALDAALEPSWSGRTEADGAIELPQRADGALLLVRHPNAASTVRRWSAEESDAWTLRAPAAPLTILAERAAGGPAAGAHLVVWLDGVRLSGIALSFATWSVPVTNREGSWTARNLPDEPLQMLVLPRSVVPASTTLDAMARRVTPPWPSSVTVRAAE